MSAVTVLLWLAIALVAAAAIAWAARALLARTLPAAGARVMADAPPTAAFGLLVVLLFLLAAVFAPALAPHGPSEAVGLVGAAPGEDPRFPLGTDAAGRDLLSQLLHGVSTSVGAALTATLLAVLVGCAIAFLSAVAGGWADRILAFLIESLNAIPTPVLALLLIAVLGPSTLTVILAAAGLGAARVFRRARAVAVRIAASDYIEAARLRGERLGSLVFGEMLPNAAAPLIGEAALRFGATLLLLAALSFLGLGVQPPAAELGATARDLAPLLGEAGADPAAAMLPLIPALSLALLAAAVYFVADWLLRPSGGLAE